MPNSNETATAVKAERHGAILVLTLDGPNSRNAIGPTSYQAIQSEVIAAGADPSIRAIVLVGSGNYFSAGGNVAALKSSAKGTLADATANTDKLNAMIMAITQCPKPVVAAVEGGAAGVGVSLVLACDMIVASASAKFTMAQVRVGLCPDGGATLFLGSALPKQLVMEMCLLGAPVGAERLASAGLINVLAPDGGALEMALGIAGRLANGPTHAMSTIKSLVQATTTAGLATQLDKEARAINACRFSAEAAEGLAAFLEKRQARFGPREDGAEDR